MPRRRGRADDETEYQRSLQRWVADRHPGLDRRLIEACADPAWRRACEQAPTGAEAIQLFDTLFAEEVFHYRQRAAAQGHRRHTGARGSDARAPRADAGGGDARAATLVRRTVVPVALLMVLGGLFLLFSNARGSDAQAGGGEERASGVPRLIRVQDQMRYHGRRTALRQATHRYERSRSRALRLYRVARRPPLTKRRVDAYLRARRTARGDYRDYLSARRALREATRRLQTSGSQSVSSAR